MKKIKEMLKRIAAAGLAVVLLAAQTPVAAFTAEDQIPMAEAIEDTIAETADDIIAEADGIAEEEDAKDNEAATSDENNSADDARKIPAFEGSKTIDGVKITVTADEGVFPEGATLSVEKVAKAQEKEAQEAIEEERPAEQNVVASYTFDIKVLDKDGNEIEPADQGKVKVFFTMDEVANENLTTNIYHITEYAAPFICVENATIKDLNVAGTIDGAAGDGITACSGSLIGKSLGTTTVSVCHSTAPIICSKEGSGELVGYNTGTLRITGCSFKGRLSGETHKSSGFVGRNDSSVSITSCLFAPASAENGYCTFVRGDGTASPEPTRAWSSTEALPWA